MVDIAEFDFLMGASILFVFSINMVSAGVGRLPVDWSIEWRVLFLLMESFLQVGRLLAVVVVAVVDDVELVD